MERNSIPVRSPKLYCLSNIYQATRGLFGSATKANISSEQEKMAFDFWEEVGRSIPEWQMAADRKVSCAELRRDYIHAHGIALVALGIAGGALLSQEPRKWKSIVTGLRDVDWRRSNADDWDGRALVNGRISKAQINVILTTNLIKKFLGVPLGSAEKANESHFLQNRKVA
jgi:DNA sulfur modification protein DndB